MSLRKIGIQLGLKKILEISGVVRQVSKKVRRKRRIIIRRRRIRKIKMTQAEHAIYTTKKEEARIIIERQVGMVKQVYAEKFGIVFPNIGRISIKNLRTRWGSCSSKGNLNFSYRIAGLPEHLRDYIIAHELCHLIEFNHGRQFWNLVALYSPDFATHRHELKSFSPYGTI